ASELDDLSLGDTDVAVKRGTPGSVDDASVLDEQVVGHLVAPFAGTTLAGTSPQDSSEGAVIHPRGSSQAGCLATAGMVAQKPGVAKDEVLPEGRRSGQYREGASATRYGAGGRESGRRRDGPPPSRARAGGCRSRSSGGDRRGGGR